LLVYFRLFLYIFVPNPSVAGVLEWAPTCSRELLAVLLGSLAVSAAEMYASESPKRTVVGQLI